MVLLLSLILLILVLLAGFITARTNDYLLLLVSSSLGMLAELLLLYEVVLGLCSKCLSLFLYCSLLFSQGLCLDITLAPRLFHTWRLINGLRSVGQNLSMLLGLLIHDLLILSLVDFLGALFVCL